MKKIYEFLFVKIYLAAIWIVGFIVAAACLYALTSHLVFVSETNDWNEVHLQWEKEWVAAHPIQPSTAAGMNKQDAERKEFMYQKTLEKYGRAVADAK